MGHVTLYTHLLEATTDDNGFFSASYEMEKSERGDWYRIDGITVAVRHTNANWHTLDFSEKVDNRFWWNESVDPKGTSIFVVEGVIASSDFHNRPVRIIAFVESNPR